MKVFLIKTPEYNLDEFNKVAKLLKSFNKAFKFEVSKYEFDLKKFQFLTPKSDAFYERLAGLFDGDDNNEMLINMQKKFKMSEDERIRFGCLTFNQLFSLCDSFRANTKDVKKEDFVVVLTKWNNDCNFFSSFNQHRNIFVRTSNWQEYPEVVDVKYPIAQQVAENILSTLMKIDFNAEKYISDYTNLWNESKKSSKDLENIDTKQSLYVHESPKGCLNDFCRSKEQVIIKLQKATICLDCIKRAGQQKINRLVFNQIMDVCAGVSDEFSYKKYALKYFQDDIAPYRVIAEIDDAGECEMFIDAPNRKLEIRIGPREQMLYIFFLKTETDVSYNDLGNAENRKELLNLYKKIRSKAKEEFSERVISNLIKSNGIFRNLIVNINEAVELVLGNDVLSEKYKVNLKEKGTATYAISLPKNCRDFEF